MIFELSISAGVLVRIARCIGDTKLTEWLPWVSETLDTVGGVSQGHSRPMGGRTRSTNSHATTISIELSQRSAQIHSILYQVQIAQQKPDRAYMDRLVAQLHKNPAAIEPRKLLMQQYVVCGLFAQAGEQAMHILTMDPTNAEAKDVRDLEQGYTALTKRADILCREAKLLQNLKGIQASDFADLISSFAALAKGVGIHESAQPARSVIPRVNTKPAQSRGGSGQLQVQAIASEKPRANPQEPVRDVLRVETAGNTSSSRNDGRTNVANNTTAVKTQKSARSVAAEIAAAYKTNRVTALDIAFKDLKGEIERKKRDPSNDREDDRQASLRRMETLKALLPSKLQHLADAAQTHVEHEVLHRKYTNTEKCGLEPASEIPRASFWVSEDAYAWDMEELATAISSNRGIMRNPLTKLMFHARDVRAIIWVKTWQQCR